jgi:uncharacterized protein (DUF433 family)
MNHRISINSNICHGQPVMANTRVPVSQILGALASGDTYSDILENYPNIKQEDIQAALDFGSELARFESYSYETAI